MGVRHSEKYSSATNSERFKEIIPVSQFSHQNGSEAFFCSFVTVYCKAYYFEKI